MENSIKKVLGSTNFVKKGRLICFFEIYVKFFVFMFRILKTNFLPLHLPEGAVTGNGAVSLESFTLYLYRCTDVHLTH
jgi:hypothetical protein